MTEYKTVQLKYMYSKIFGYAPMGKENPKKIVVVIISKM